LRANVEWQDESAQLVLRTCCTLLKERTPRWISAHVASPVHASASAIDPAHAVPGHLPPALIIFAFTLPLAFFTQHTAEPWRPQVLCASHFITGPRHCFGSVASFTDDFTSCLAHFTYLPCLADPAQSQASAISDRMLSTTVWSVHVSDVQAPRAEGATASDRANAQRAPRSIGFICRR
jgi:hypothetical protein